MELLLRIPNKDGVDSDFILNQDQASFDAAQTGRDIIAKYRQGGFSTYPLARNLIKCMNERNRRVAIIAHNSDTTQKLLARVQYMIKHIKCPPPDLKYSTQTRLVFNKTDSHMFIGTAGSDDFGVGDTITDLHCSEVSRWPKPDALLTGLFQAVPPTGNILIEATGHGQGNWFHQAVQRAVRGNGRYKLHFYSWLNTPEYRVRMTPDEAKAFMDNLDLTLEEPKYAALGLDAEQLAWRRLQLADLNYDTALFQENYPVTLNECFQATGHAVFGEVNFIEDKNWRAHTPWLSILGDHPKPGLGYVFGVDTAGGVGQDYSVIEGFDALTGEQVLEYRNNMIEPDRFGAIVVEWARKFNNAYLNPERNNHGILVIKTILGMGYPQLRIHQARMAKGRAPTNEVATLADFGSYTSSIVKTLMVGALQEQARSDLTLHSEVLRLEMGSFIEKDSGAMEAEVGCYDDCVMAAALAAYVRPRAATLFQRLQADASRDRSLSRLQTFEAGRALSELEARYNAAHGALPISSGVDEVFGTDYSGTGWGW
jgi:hypothetical protein